MKQERQTLLAELLGQEEAARLAGTDLADAADGQDAELARRRRRKGVVLAHRCPRMCGDPRAGTGRGCGVGHRDPAAAIVARARAAARSGSDMIVSVTTQAMPSARTAPAEAASAVSMTRVAVTSR